MASLVRCTEPRCTWSGADLKAHLRAAHGVIEALPPPGVPFSWTIDVTSPAEPFSRRWTIMLGCRTGGEPPHWYLWSAEQELTPGGALGDMHIQMQNLTVGDGASACSMQLDGTDVGRWV